jgi:hypothetical protein
MTTKFFSVHTCTKQSPCFLSQLETFLENEPEEEEALIQLLETPINSNHQSTVSKELKFKESSTAKFLRNHLTTSLIYLDYATIMIQHSEKALQI